MKKKFTDGVVIGIDLGTTNSVAAILESDGNCRIIPNADGEALTPSVVNLRDEKKPVVGRAAVNQWAFAPEHTASLFKRSMGKWDTQGRPIPAFIHQDSGKAYSPEELSSLLVRFLVQGVESALGAKVVGAVISVPAYFDPTARDATRRAGELAGVEVLRIINEPTAAGLAFALDSDEAGTTAVFDLGGGTFDITIMRREERDFRVLATDGDCNLGGSDIDNLIRAKAVGAFTAEYGSEISAETDLITYQDLGQKSENAKKTLSQSETASFMISSRGQRLIFELTRADLDALIAPLLDKTRAITERTLKAAQCKADDIKNVVLVGGSTRIPAVREMLTRLFGKPPRTDAKPDEAVAMGAAIFAAKMAGDAGLAVVDSEGKKVLPPPVDVVAEVTSRPLGCLAKRDGAMRNCVIIPANTELPAERKETFALERENQTAAEVVMTSGADGADPSDCRTYGRLELTDLPVRSPEENSIEVKYGFEGDGTLDIWIKDLVSGKTVKEIKRGLNDLLGGGHS